MQNPTSTKAEVRQTVSDLYRDLTTYDYFVFFFFYRDVTGLLARTSKTLQQQDLQIADVGRIITTLCKRLKTFYGEENAVPTDIIGDGHGNSLLCELFGTKSTSTISSIWLQLMY
jgi:hypothetical protein